MPHFEWKTDDRSISWPTDEPIRLTTPWPETSTTLSGWAKLVILTVFGLMGGFVLALQWSVQVGRRETEITADVQASYQLLQEMLTNQDAALVPNIALNPHHLWWEDSRTAFEQQQFLQFTLVGWRRTAVTVDKIDLSPDHLQAIVYTTEEYQVHERTAAEETVHLQRPFVFQQTNGRWLWAGFTERTWQQTAHKQGAYVTTTYPANDQTQALAVHRAIDTAIGRYCYFTPGNTCPFDLQLNLTLTEEPTAAFPQYDNWQLPSLSITHITLPTPALIGQPATANDRQWLAKQYVSHIIAILNAHLLGPSTIANQPSPVLYHALLDYQLEALDLPPIIPYTQSSIEKLPITLDVYNRALSNTQDELCLACIRPLIDFLQTTHPQITPFAMQQQLYQAPDFETWLNHVTIWDDLSREKAWQQFQMSRAAQG